MKRSIYFFLLLCAIGSIALLSNTLRSLQPSVSTITLSRPGSISCHTHTFQREIVTLASGDAETRQWIGSVCVWLRPVTAPNIPSSGSLRLQSTTSTVRALSVQEPPGRVRPCSEVSVRDALERA